MIIETVDVISLYLLYLMGPEQMYQTNKKRENKDLVVVYLSSSMMLIPFHMSKNHTIFLLYLYIPL